MSYDAHPSCHIFQTCNASSSFFFSDPKFSFSCHKDVTRSTDGGSFDDELEYSLFPGLHLSRHPSDSALSFIVFVSVCVSPFDHQEDQE